MTERSTPSTVQKRLKKKGYDGLLGEGLTGAVQIVAWSPDQVKLVEQNPKHITICKDCGQSPCFEKWHEFNVPVDLSQLLVSKSALYRATQDWFDGRGSKMGSLPLDLWVLEDGRKLLVDGYHRLVKILIQGKTSFGHRVVGKGYSDYWATPRPDDVFEFRADLPFGGLETIYPAASLGKLAKLRRWKMYKKKNPPRYRSRQTKCPCGAKGTRVIETSEGTKHYFCTPHFKEISAKLGGQQNRHLPIKQSKARSTGTTVSLIEGNDSDGKWALVCEEHAGTIHFDLKATAISYMAAPEQWCPTCQENE